MADRTAQPPPTPAWIQVDATLHGYVGDDQAPLSRLGPLSRINLFVGANSSGKSRLLRWLFHSWDGAFIANIFDENSNLEPIFQVMREIIDLSQSTPPRKLGNDLLRSLNYPKPIKYGGGRFELIDPDLLNAVQRFSDANLTQKLQRLHQITRQPDPVGPRCRRYIPIIRGARKISTGSTDPYLDSTLTDYREIREAVDKKKWGLDPIPGVGSAVFTGQNMYELVRSMLLGDLAARNRVRGFEDFLARTFFNDRKIAIIPRESGNTLFIKVGNDKERAVAQLGDGIQAIIVLTCAAFLDPNPSFFFVEEPELNLHPGLQRVLLTAWSAEPSLARHVLFATTHSNHMLELTSDQDHISVFTFERAHDPEDTSNEEVEAKFRVANVAHGDENPLRLLGVSHASVMLVNGVILVEGITDRLALRALLDCYARSTRWPYKEDVHYSLVEYGGSNIVHWDFSRPGTPSGDIVARRILPHTLVIVDGDGAEEGSPKPSSTRQARHDKLREQLDSHLIVLPCREMENVIPPAALSRVAERMGGTLNPEPTWSAYRHEYLGGWLDKHAPRPEGSAAWSQTGDQSAERGKTIRNKDQFWRTASRVLRQMDFEDLEPEIRSVVIQIANFVRDTNKLML